MRIQAIHFLFYIRPLQYIHNLFFQPHRFCFDIERLQPIEQALSMRRLQRRQLLPECGEMPPHRI